MFLFYLFLVHFSSFFFFFFNDTATTEIYTLSLHDALPISDSLERLQIVAAKVSDRLKVRAEFTQKPHHFEIDFRLRSEEHTSELQSRLHLVCRLLLEKKKKRNKLQYTK